MMAAIPSLRQNPARKTVYWLMVITLVLAIVSVMGCSPATVDHPPIRILGVTYLGDLPTLVAKEQGIFARHGLTTEVTFELSGKDNLEILHNGGTEFALMAPSPFVLDRLADDGSSPEDAPVILANLVHSTRLNQVVVLAESGIRVAKDLPGRRVGLVRGTNADYLWWLLTGFHRLDINTIEIIDTPIDRLGDALITGTVDAAVIWEPWTTRLRETLGQQLQYLADGDIYTGQWVLVTTRRLVHEQPELCQQVLMAYGDAIAFIEQFPQAALQMHADHSGTSVDVLSDEPDLGLFTLTLNWSLLAELQQGIEWARAIQAEGATRESNILSWIEAEPLRAVAPGAVGILSLTTKDTLP